MSNTEIITNKASKKKIYIFAGIALAIILLTVIGIIAYSNTPAVRLQKQLDLGNRYLSEMEYEKAIAEYEAVIEIDSRNVEAYLGLADAYIGLGEYDKAMEALKRGYEETGNEELRDRSYALSDVTDSANGQKVDIVSSGEESLEGFAGLAEEIENESRYAESSTVASAAGEAGGAFAAYEVRRERHSDIIRRLEEYVSFLDRTYVPELCESRDYTTYQVKLDGYEEYFITKYWAYLLLNRYYLEEDRLDKCLEIRGKWAEFIDAPEMLEDENDYGEQFRQGADKVKYDKYGRLTYYKMTTTDSSSGSTHIDELNLYYDDNNRITREVTNYQNIYSNAGTYTGTTTREFIRREDGRIDNYTDTIEYGSGGGYSYYVEFEYLDETCIIGKTTHSESGDTSTTRYILDEKGYAHGE